MKGKHLGVDGFSRGANTASKARVRCNTGDGCQEMPVRLVRASVIEAPIAEDLIRIDRKRNDKTLSAKAWASSADPHSHLAPH